MQTNLQKNGSKNSLASEVNRYKFVLRKIERLEEQIKYYEMKMHSIGGPTYGTDVRGVSNPYDNRLIYWLDKIDIVKERIKPLEMSIERFLKFINNLPQLERNIIITNLIEGKTLDETSKVYGVTPNKVSKIKYKVNLKWNELVD